MAGRCFRFTLELVLNGNHVATITSLYADAYILDCIENREIPFIPTHFHNFIRTQLQIDWPMISEIYRIVINNTNLLHIMSNISRCKKVVYTGSLIKCTVYISVISTLQSDKPKRSKSGFKIR